MDTMTIEEARERVTKPLTNLPELPGETDTQSDFIGGDVGEVMEDAGLSKDEKIDKLRGTLSDKGEPWDPELHSWPPNMTQAGAWKKRRKRKSGEPEGQPNAEFRAAAQNAAILYANLNFIALGEGAEIDKEVLPMVVDGFENYYKEKGIQEIPAWAGVVLGCANYSFTVATKPKPKERVKGWYQSLKGMFKRDKEETSLFGEISEVAGDMNARSDSRE